MSFSRDRVLSTLIEQIDSPNFQETFLQTIDALVSFDMAMIAIYDKGRLSSCSSYQFPSGVSSKALRDFSEVTFQYNPFFQHHLRGIESGVYLMSHLLKNETFSRPNEQAKKIVFDDREEIGYITPGWPRGLKELDFVVRTGPTQTAQIALYRAGRSQFNSHDVSQLASIRMSLAAIFMKASAAARSARHDRSEAEIVENLLTTKALSAREKDVVRLIIAGFATDGIAEKLRIGKETVKTVRKRAYAKLGISSRTDLFSGLLSSYSKS